MVSPLAEQIFKIGERMVGCTEDNCTGTFKSRIEGLVPRCLILDRADHDKELGCVIVGLNPGHARREELEYYGENPRYNILQEYWDTKLRSYSYYERLQNVATILNIDGPILWTELVKCEIKGVSKIPVQTFRTCMRLYLYEELKLIPSDWPIIAAGKEAFTTVSYRFPDRVVIGVPHPTGAHIDYNHFFDKDPSLSKGRKLIVELGKENRASWLFDEWESEELKTLIHPKKTKGK